MPDLDCPFCKSRANFAVILPRFVSQCFECIQGAMGGRDSALRKPADDLR